MRISVTLVQVDAVVIDKKGRYVTNLKPDDFEISEDGKRQQITNFSYVETQAATPPSNRAEPGKPSNKTAVLPPAPLRPESVRRTIALVVDDLGLSFESLAYARSALKKFVNEQMQPGDLVAIIRTSAGIGALQQFTNDKRILNAAIEHVRWNGFGRNGISAFSPVGGSPGRSISAGGSDTDPQKETVEQFREELFTVGTLGGVNFVIRALRELPGRKSILLFSDGFQLFSNTRADLNQRVFQTVRRLTDLGNRSSVVIYTMDARGLQTAGLTAADRTNSMGTQLDRSEIVPQVRKGMEPEEIRNQLLLRHQELLNMQDGLHYLAAQNGEMINQESREYTFRVPEAEFDRFKRQGLLYNLTVPIKKPGAYQLRVAVRDAASEKTGSANQFIEVPDVAKKRLALSGLVVGGSDPGKQTPQGATEVINAAEGRADASNVESGPSERIFRRGMQLHFGLAIYNATVTGATGRPQLEGQVIMLRDGKALYTSQPAAIDLTGQTDWNQVIAGGKLQLGSQLEPGEYVLQVIVTDRLAKEPFNRTTQWIDFEIVQ